MNPTESPLNNPSHPCSFCGEPVPIARPYCNTACENRDEILKNFLSIAVEEQESAFNPNVSISHQ